MELLERDRYLEELTGWLGASAEHGGCAVLVGGEAGIGKTVLLQEFAGRQRHDRESVAREVRPAYTLVRERRDPRDEG